MVTSLLWLALLCASLTFVAGIRLELTHVDAREKCTVEERMRRATERTHRRLASMGNNKVTTAPVHWSGSQYVAEYLIGNPPQKAEALLDTASNLVWTQCTICYPRCFAQDLPYYAPTLSDSHPVLPLPCNATACALGPEARCDLSGTSCLVVAGYGFGEVAGLLAIERFVFGSENATLAFGCVAASKITPGALHGASGVLGLGRGAMSLVSQLGATRFAYCLTPYFRDNVTTSYLFVGEAAGGLSSSNTSSSPVTSVPFVKSPDEYPFSTYYYLPLAGISVGNATLAVPAAAFELRQVAPGTWAGTLIDSGSPFTDLVDVAYRALRKELARQLGASLVTPPDEALDLCVSTGDLGKLVPPMVLHFGADGDVVVPPENYWAPWDNSTACMVVFSSAAGPNATLPMNETTVIGNYMQQDMHLLYDIGKGVLSFQQADCSSM